jgi:hypothetical protein
VNGLSVQNKIKEMVPEGKDWQFPRQLNTFLTVQVVQAILLKRAETLYFRNRPPRRGAPTLRIRTLEEAA